MFQAGLLLINRRYYAVYTCLCWPVVDRILLKAGQHKGMAYTNCCIYRVLPPDDKQ